MRPVSTTGERRSPHVILICTDQWRGDCLSAVGHPDVETPVLDQLAHEGALFTRAYSPHPTCVPARVSMLTGLNGAHHGRVGYQDGVPFDIEATLPREFGKAGYQTQAIGKLHVFPERSRVGFDNVVLHDGYLHHSRRRRTPVEFYDDYLPWMRDQAGVAASEDYIEEGLGCNSIVARPWDKAERLHPTNWVVTQAEQFFYRRDPNVPFFLFLSFHRPHAPLDPPGWAFERYRDAELAAPATGDWDELFAEWREDASHEAFVASYSDSVSNRARAAYYGSLTHIDTQLQRLRELLHEFELDDDTIVCFTSDHGDMLGDHGMWRKGYAYEGSARVPMILHGPGVPRGRSDALVDLCDLMPTLLSLAGLEIPEDIDGKPMFDGCRSSLHGEHVIFGQSMQWIIKGGFKYIWLSGDGIEQLFDLVADPCETTDLARNADNFDALEALRECLIECLTDRPEGFVADGRLVTGRPVASVLTTPVGRG